MTATLETRNTIARAVMHVNNARLDGIISREDHAKCVRQIQADMTRYGLTWDDVDADVTRLTREG